MQKINPAITHPAIDAMRTELAAIELDVTTSYTLADAMRDGAKHTGQLIGGYVNADESCGLGAAYLAAVSRGYVTE